MFEKTYLHCDFNNFFSSAEQVDGSDNELLPTAVAGNYLDRKSIILAKNKLAKAFGVKTGEPLTFALVKCPQLNIISPHFSSYVQYSKNAFSLYHEYADLVQPFGIDECWLDVSSICRDNEDCYRLAQSIRRRVKSDFKLTVSVGVSFSKVYAKLASDLARPDHTLIISRHNYRNFAWKLSAASLLGVGPTTNKVLSRRGLYYIEDLVFAGNEFVINLLGKMGGFLWQSACGYDTDMYVDNAATKQKSYSKSTTVTSDMSNRDTAATVLLKLAQGVCEDLRKEHLFANLLEIKTRDRDLHSHTYRKKILPTRDPVILAQLGTALLRDKYDSNLSLRSIGIAAGELISERELPLSFFYDMESQDNELNSSINKEKRRKHAADFNIFNSDSTLTAESPVKSHLYADEKTGEIYYIPDKAEDRYEVRRKPVNAELHKAIAEIRNRYNADSIITLSQLMKEAG